MAIAVGGGRSNRPSFGAVTIDARDFGVRADGNDCSVALQSAIDAAIQAIAGHDGYNRAAIVRVVSSSTRYVLNSPVYLDSDLVAIEGEGLGNTIFETGIFPQRPAFVLGLPRGQGALRFGLNSNRYGQLDPSYRIDLYGILDSTAVNASGQHWGIRTNLDSLVQVQCGALITDWQSLRNFVIELCIDTGDGHQQLPAGIRLIGRGDGYNPAPWVIYSTSSSQLTFGFKTSDQNGPGNPRRGFTFPLTGVGPYRISIQVDLDTGRAQVYVNGIQVVVNGGSWTPGLSLYNDDYKPFFLGNSSNGISAGGGMNADITFYGFLVANKLRYKDTGIGEVQLCVDSVPILAGKQPTDQFRYFGMSRFDTISGDSFVRLSCSESPTSLDRMVKFNEGPGLFDSEIVGYLLNESVLSSGIANNAIRNLTVLGNGRSQLILLGSVLHTQIQNVRAASGWHGIGSVNIGASYIINLKDCSLSGTDATYYGYWQIIHAQNILFESYSTTIVRLVGCDLQLRDFFAGDSSTASSFFKFHASAYGGNFSISDGIVDGEGTTLSYAGIYLEQHPYTQTSITLKDLQLGSVGSAPVIKLHDIGSYNPTQGLLYGWLDVTNVNAWFSGPYLELDGGSFYGKIDGLPNMSGLRIAHKKVYGSNCNIVLRESSLSNLPRSDSWYPGAHLLVNDRPSDGQFIEWRCIGEGTFGTSNPPVFIGSNICMGRPSSIAGYINCHCYITVGIA